MEALGQKLLPLYALALDLPRDYFLPLFDGAHINLRLSHYPANAAAEDNQFGIAPHADAGFLTMLPQSEVPELRSAPPQETGSPRRLAGELPGQYRRHAQPLDQRPLPVDAAPRQQQFEPRALRDAVLLRPEHRHDDRMPADLPGPGNPPRYPPQTYGDFYAWFIARNYAHQQDAAE